MIEKQKDSLSIGLAVVLGLCTAVIAVSNIVPRVSTCPERCTTSECCDHCGSCGQCDSCVKPSLLRPTSPTGSIGNSAGAIQAPTVNHDALNSMKFQECLPCKTPNASSGTYFVSVRKSGETQRYELALFLGNDAKSAAMLKWFETDPDLAELRGRCDFQTYTPTNPMYKSRFANIVPVSEFPAILFLKPDGGHVHAAGGNMIPGDSQSLFLDLVESYKLSKSVETAPDRMQGLIREKGYSWDDQIAPQMQLSPQDCVDGSCDVSGLDGSRLNRLDDLFNRNRTKNAVVWAGATEIAVFVMLGLIVVLVVAVALKKMKD